MENLLGNSDISGVSSTITGAITTLNSKIVLGNANTAINAQANTDGSWLHLGVNTTSGSKYALLAGTSRDGIDFCNASDWNTIWQCPNTTKVGTMIDNKIAGKQDNIPIKMRTDLISQWNGQIHQQLTFIYGRIISIHVELISPTGGIAPWSSLFSIPRPLSAYEVYLGCWFLSDGTARSSYYTADPYSLISSNGWAMPEGYNHFIATYVTQDQL